MNFQQYLNETKDLAVKLYQNKLQDMRKNEEKQNKLNVIKSKIFNELVQYVQPFHNLMLESKHPLQIKSTSNVYQINIFSVDRPNLLKLTVEFDKEEPHILCNNQIFKNVDSVMAYVVQTIAPLIQLPKDVGPNG